VTVIKPSFVIKGALTFVLPRWAFSRSSGGSGSARYCYSVFMRHLVRLNQETGFTVPGTVAELGPGDSLGLGLCALLTGAERYVGLDVVRFADLSGNVQVLDELVSLFQARTPIPDDQEFPRVRPKLDDYAFPSDILDDATLARTLGAERIQALRVKLLGGGGDMITYVAPWYASDQIQAAGVDWIFSQAVLEHVDDLDGAYRAFAAWLKPEGVMSHQIDFKCHNMAKSWNGHWACSDWLWRVVRGRRPYLLNREPVTTHQALLERHGFDVLSIDRALRDDGHGVAVLPARFQGLSNEDIATAGAFVIVRQAGAEHA